MIIKLNQNRIKFCINCWEELEGLYDNVKDDEISRICIKRIKYDYQTQQD